MTAPAVPKRNRNVPQVVRRAHGRAGYTRRTAVALAFAMRRGKKPLINRREHE